MWNKKTRGFTLLELLIVLTLISILCAVAYSSYQPIILKARRIDAQVTLLHYHTQMQQCFITQHDFSLCAADLNLLTPYNSFEGFYQIKVEQLQSNSFILQAEVQGNQENDKHCWRFTIDQRLQKLAYDKQGLSNTDCW